MTKKTRPFTIRLSNSLIDKCNLFEINKTEVCRIALTRAIDRKESKLIKKETKNERTSDN